MQDFKKRYKNTLKNIIFFLILVMLFEAVSLKMNRVLINNDNLIPVRSKNIYRIQGESPKSIDVIVLGDSLSYSSISPMQLWAEYGISSFVCGQSGQQLCEAEEMLKTALTGQKPRLVILEANMLFRDCIKGKTLNDTIESGLDHYLPVFRGHDVWKTLITRKDYPEENYKGFGFRCNVKPYENGDYMKDNGLGRKMPDTVMKHMDSVISMCQAAGAKILLLGTPSPMNYSYAKHIALCDYAERHSLTFLDMNIMLKEIGIDWKTDSLDQGDHLNLSGAEKVTAFLGSYLSGQYELPDHRGDPAYAGWERESEVYLEKAARLLKEIRESSLR